MSTATVNVGRYLVTGGAGFIGSHLCDTLLEQGCEVVCLDSMVTGNRNNLAAPLRNKNFQFIEADICEPLKLDGAFAGIFHLASPASPIDYARLPILTLRTGAVGGDNVLALAKEKQCPILVASTSEVYGDPLIHPQVESYWGNVNPIGPRSCYDESKRYLEAITMAYHRVHQVPVRIVRIFNTYGPRMREQDGRVVPNFCMQALQGKDLTVFGDGTQTRSFCHVSDMVEGLLRRIQEDDPNPVNLGNPAEITVQKFAEKVLEISGSPSKIIRKPLPVDDPKQRQPNISRAKELLGWSPKVPIDQGLRETLEYFRSRVDG